MFHENITFLSSLINRHDIAYAQWGYLILNEGI